MALTFAPADPQESAAARDATATPPPTTATTIAMFVRTFTHDQLPAFAHGEADRLAAGATDTVTDTGGQGWRTLPAWLEAPATAEVRFRSEALTVTIGSRIPQAPRPKVLPMVGLDAVFTVAGLAEPISGSCDVDEDAARLVAELRLDDTNRDTVFAALQAAGQATLGIRGTHQYLRGDVSGLVPWDGPLLAVPRGDADDFSVAAGDTWERKLDVTGAAQVAADVTVAGGGTATLALVGPDGGIRASATGAGRCGLLVPLTSRAAGADGWRLRITADAAVSGQVRHTPAFTPLIHIRPDRPFIMFGGHAHRFVADAPHDDPPADPPHRHVILADIERHHLDPRIVGNVAAMWTHVPYHLDAGHSGQLTFLAGGPDGALVSVSGDGRAPLSVLGRDASGAFVASAFGSGSLLVVMDLSGGGSIVVRNNGDAAVDGEVLHTATTAPGGGAQSVPLSLDVDLTRPRADRPQVYPELASGPPQWLQTPAGLWFAPTDEEAGTWQYLPSSFRLGFFPDSGLPAVRPRLYVRPGAPETPGEADYRVEVTLVAVPDLRPEERDALREHLQDSRGLPYAGLVPATSLAATFVPQSDGGDGVPVNLAECFVLKPDMTAFDYTLFAEQLKSNLGVTGFVRIPLPGDKQASIPVKLNLQTPVTANVVRRGQFGPAAVRLENAVQEPATVTRGRAWCVDRRSNYLAPRHAWSCDLGTDITLTPGTPVTVEVKVDEPGAHWTRIDVDLDDVVLPTPASAWLDLIHEKAASGGAQFTVGVTIVGQVPDGLTGIQVSLLVDGAERGSALLTAAPWRFAQTIVRSLAEYASGKARAYAVELRAVYAAGDFGLPQRLYGTSETLVVRLPGVEAADSRYVIETRPSPDGETWSAASGALDRDAARTQIDALRAAGKEWRLRVLAPGEEVTGPANVPPPAGGTFTILADGLDFENTLKRVVMVLRQGDATDQFTHVFDSATPDPFIWTLPGTGPVHYDVAYFFKAGGLARRTGTETGATLLLLAPDQPD